jgi:ribonuclease Z
MKKPKHSRDAGIDELKVGGLTLQGVTRGGVETCLMVPELKLMFDVGMVPGGALGYGTILISHGHADHLGGLAYYLAQRRMTGLAPPKVHVPEEIVEPLGRIFAAWGEIAGRALEVELSGHAPGDKVELGRGLTAYARRSTHRVPSLAWVIERESRRLRAELIGRSHTELAALRREGVEITQPHREIALCVTGDTQIELLREDPLVGSARVLVHEVTGWDDRRDVAATRRWGHTHLDEMIEHAERHFSGEALVLVHRSMRHSRAEADRLVRERFPAALRERVHVFGR